jgi:nitroreductase
MSTRISRRDLLLAGAGVAAFAGASARTGAADPELSLPNTRAAYEPWASWRADAPRSPLTLVHSAVLAANAHDTQPWRFHIDAGRIDVYPDTARNLGAMDPFRRELHLSLGCAVENAVLIGRSKGYASSVRPGGGSLLQASAAAFPECAASIDLAAAPAATSPLAAAIPHRHTNRTPYREDRNPSDEQLDLLRFAASDGRSTAGDGAVRLIWITDRLARRDFAAATVAATQSIVSDPVMIADSDRWFRGSDAEIELHRDGPTLYCAGLSPLMLSLARLLPSISPQSSHRHWIDQTRDAQLSSTPVIGLIAVRDLYDREQALNAGRLWQRLHLQGTLVGLGMQPLNQLPECADRELQLGKPPVFRKTLTRLAGDADWQPTFAFRIGWPTRPGAASPRRPLDSVIG